MLELQTPNPIEPWRGTQTLPPTLSIDAAYAEQSYRYMQGILLGPLNVAESTPYLLTPKIVVRLFERRPNYHQPLVLNRQSSRSSSDEASSSSRICLITLLSKRSMTNLLPGRRKVWFSRMCMTFRKRGICLKFSARLDLILTRV